MAILVAIILLILVLILLGVQGRMNLKREKILAKLAHLSRRKTDHIRYLDVQLRDLMDGGGDDNEIFYEHLDSLIMDRSQTEDEYLQIEKEYWEERERKR